MPEKEYQNSKDEITVADLYPDLSPAQQAEAEYRMLRYLTAVREIFERICEKNSNILTELERRAMLRKERQK